MRYLLCKKLLANGKAGIKKAPNLFSYFSIACLVILTKPDALALS